MFYMITAAPDQICYGIGYALQPITVRFDVNYYFMNCKKKVIANIGDYKDSWTGKSAKWIDECTPPDTSPIIRVFDIDFTKGIGETAVLGGTTTGKLGCFKYGNWTSWAPYLLGYGQWFLK